MKNSKINSFELCSLIPFITSSAFMGSGYLYLFNTSNKSILISLLIGLVLSIPINIMTFKMFNSYPESTVVEKINKSFNKFFAFLLYFLIIVATFSMGGVVLFRLVTFFETQFLTDLPKLFLSFLLGILVFYLSSKNVETLTRFSVLTFFICLFTFLFNCISLLPYVELTNVLPIIDTSFNNILYSSIVTTILFSGPSFLLLIIPKNQIVDSKKIKKYSILFYIISAVSLIIILFLTLSTLGIEVIKLYTYPVYIVLKKIHVFEFINSIENITILFWFFYLIVTASLSFMFCKNTISELFKIKKPKNQNIVLSIIVLLGIFIPAFAFKNISALDKPDLVEIPFSIYGIFIIVTIIYLIFRKKQQN